MAAITLSSWPKLDARNAADLVDRAYRVGYLPRARQERNEETEDPEDSDS